MLDLAQKAKAKPVASLAFVPPLDPPGDPDFGMIQAGDRRPRSRRGGDGRRRSRGHARSRRRRVRGPEAEDQQRAAASTPDPAQQGADTSNLSKVCSA